MSHNVTPNTSRVELRKTLTLVPVVMMGLAYMQPMTLFDTFGIVSGLTEDRKSVCRERVLRLV